MILSSTNNLTIFLFITLFFIWLFFVYKIYNRNNKLISSIFLFLSFLFLIINIFEIKWWLKSKIENIDWWKIVFVLDVSKSMDTMDWLDNNNQISRIDLWKKIINSYISNNLNNSYWLIIFSWESIEVLPFTEDLSLFNTVLYWINNSKIYKNWTNINSVFVSLNNYFFDNEWWLVVFLTDWWDDKIDISDNALKTISEKWLNISILWIGTKDWWKIPTWKDMYWNTIYKKYNWADILTKLNTKEFSELSKKYNFSYKDFFNYEYYDEVEDFINNKINLVNMKKNIDYRFDYTRLFIFISFFFFILFLIYDNFVWIRK